MKPKYLFKTKQKLLKNIKRMLTQKKFRRVLLIILFLLFTYLNVRDILDFIQKLNRQIKQNVNTFKRDKL